MQNVTDTVSLMDKLGLTVHPDKSVINPVQCIEFVGFVINSLDMTVRLTPRKAADILNQKQVLIREFAKPIGKFAAAEPGVSYAALHYKSMEVERDSALKRVKGDFDHTMGMSDISCECVC